MLILFTRSMSLLITYNLYKISCVQCKRHYEQISSLMWSMMMVTLQFPAVVFPMYNPKACHGHTILLRAWDPCKHSQIELLFCKCIMVDQLLNLLQTCLLVCPCQIKPHSELKFQNITFDYPPFHERIIISWGGALVTKTDWLHWPRKQD